MFQTQTVSEVNARVRRLIEDDIGLQDIWVAGEISNFTRAQSGHLYFSLKDSDSQIRCVMWRGDVTNLSVMPKNGDSVEAHGKISVYEPRGEYQLYADIIRPVGVGALYQQFERLKKKLIDEGLVDRPKRSYPEFPQKIGVVTSPNAAAFQDILNVLRRRYPQAEVILSPTLVQGIDAPPQIVAAIERLNDFTNVDVILLCRGGGSIEDLWAFNDEAVARTVAASRIPIVSGVGHETDFTIVDFVSDERAPTPSAAAELVTPDMAEMKLDLYQTTEKLAGMMLDIILQRQASLDAANRSIERSSPKRTIETKRQRIDELNSRMARSIGNKLKLTAERLRNKAAALDAASPQAILRRGYGIITRSEDGKRIVSEYDAKPGTGIRIQLRDGELKARIEDNDTHERYKRTLF